MSNAFMTREMLSKRMYRIKTMWRPVDLRTAWYIYHGVKLRVIRITGQWHVRTDNGQRCFVVGTWQEAIDRLRVISEAVKQC